MKINRPAVFLDRDGTINVESGYVHRWEDWKWIPGAIEAIAKLNHLGFLVIVVSNQAGMARGYYNEAAVHRLHDAVDADLARYGSRIDAYYFCPHHPEFGLVRECNCRKPKPGLIYQAMCDFNIDLARSWLVGDKATDVEAGVAAGVRSILVETGYGKSEESLVNGRVVREKDLPSAVRRIEFEFNRESQIAR